MEFVWCVVVVYEKGDLKEKRFINLNFFLVWES